MINLIIFCTFLSCVFAEAPLRGGYSNSNSNNRNSYSAPSRLPSSFGNSFGSSGSSFGSLSSGNSGDGLNEYVDMALLQRIVQLIDQGGDGSGTRQSNDAAVYVDQATFSRVADVLGASGGFGNPEPAQRIAEFHEDDQKSGSPTFSSGNIGSFGNGGDSYSNPAAGGPLRLDRPEVAQRVADFDLMESTQQRRNSFEPQSSYFPQSQGRGGYSF